MILTIYGSDGVKKMEVSPDGSSVRTAGIQEDDVLALSFTSYEHVVFSVNDYVDFCGRRYWLQERCLPVEKNGQEWKYSLKFYGVSSLVKRFLVLNTAGGTPHAVFSLTGPARDHVALIVQCINEGFGTTDWKVGEVADTENIVVDYEGTYCHEGLEAVAKKAGVEYWFDGTTVNLTRCEYGEEVALAYGKGLTELEPSTADGVKLYTRLFPIGSGRNIDPSEYGHSRLQLPGGAEYVDVNTDKYGIIHHFEQDAFAGIYPRRIGTVGSVRSENTKDRSGKELIVWYFKDPDIDFNPNEHELPGETKRVSFQSGELQGLGSGDDHFFEVNYDDKNREFEIITIRPYSDDEQLPGGSLVPKPGDTYILWNIRMPESYIRAAEQEFREAVDEYNERHAKDVAVYKAPTDPVYIEEHGIELYPGRRVRIESPEYFPEGFRSSRVLKISQRVNCPSQMEVEIGDALSTGKMQQMGDRIEDVKNYVKHSPGSRYEVVRSWEKTPPSDYNVASFKMLLKQIAERALSKLEPDAAMEVITFLKGLETGNYVVGVSGAKVDDYGRAEFAEVTARGSVSATNVDAVTVEADAVRSDDFVAGMLGTGYELVKRGQNGKSYLEVDEIFARVKAVFAQLEVRKLTYSGGNFVFSPAGVTVTRVEERADVYRCFFTADDGETAVENPFRADDLVQMRTVNIRAGVHEGVRNRYFWRRCVATGADYVELSKTDRDMTSDDAPAAGDVLVTVGNRTDKTRQHAIVVSVYGEGSPSIIQYAGIDGFSLEGKARIVISPERNRFTGEFVFSASGTDVETYVKSVESTANAAKQESAQARTDAEAAAGKAEAAGAAAGKAQDAADAAGSAAAEAAGEAEAAKGAADSAANKAASAQGAAEAAAGKAAAAQNAADAAGSAASKAQSDASKAQGAANAAQSAADKAQSDATAAAGKAEAAQGKADAAAQKAQAAEDAANGMTKTVTELTEKVSDFNVTVDGLKSTVSATTTKVETMNRTLNSTNETLEETKNKLEGMQIGVRNLLLESDVEQGRNAYTLGWYEYAKPLVPGKEYTVVCCYTLGANNTGVGFYSGAGWQNWEFRNKMPKAIGTWTFVFGSEPLEFNEARFYQFPNGTFGTKVHWAVLVEGNKAPRDWFPAPEDISNDVHVGVRNLIRNSEVMLVDDTTGSNYKFIEACKLESDTEYALSVQDIEAVRGTPTEVQVVVHNATHDKFLKSIFLRVGEGYQSAVFRVPVIPEGEKVRLLLYSAAWGETANKGVKYHKVALVKGNRPLADWVAAPEDMQSEIDGMQVGTRNLIKNRQSDTIVADDGDTPAYSSFSHRMNQDGELEVTVTTLKAKDNKGQPSRYFWWEQLLSVPIVPDFYVFSFDYKTDCAGGWMYIDARTHDHKNKIAAEKYVFENTGGAWRRGHILWDLRKFTIQDWFICSVRATDTEVGKSVTYRNLKLVRGNRGWDDSVAPEDTESKITSVTERTSRLEQKADSITMEVGKVTERVTTVERDVVTAQGAANAAQSAANKALSDAKGYTDGKTYRTTTIDARGLDEGKYYPVTIQLEAGRMHSFKLYRRLGKEKGVPSWSTHANGFTVMCAWRSNGSGWGEIGVDGNRTVDIYDSAWTTVVPVGSIGQMGHSSKEYIYVRGGSMYYLQVDQGGGPVVLHETAYTEREQTVDILTEVVKPAPDFKTFKTETKSKFELTDNAIEANVSSINSVNDRVVKIESAGYITTEKGNELYASKILEDGTEIVSRINQSAGEVKIEAKNIKLEGLVTANERFQVLEDGSIRAKNAYVEGEIHATSGEFTGKIYAKEGWIGSIFKGSDGSLSGNGLVLADDGIRSVNFSNANKTGTYYSTRGMSVYAGKGGILAPSTGFAQAARLVSKDAAGAIGLEVIADGTSSSEGVKITAKSSGSLAEIAGLTVDAYNSYSSPVNAPVAIKVVRGLTKLGGKLEVSGSAMLGGMSCKVHDKRGLKSVTITPDMSVVLLNQKDVSLYNGSGLQNGHIVRVVNMYGNHSFLYGDVLNGGNVGHKVHMRCSKTLVYYNGSFYAESDHN